MAVGIFALALWVLASIPLGLLLGWACGLNKLSPRGHEVEPRDAGPIFARPSPEPRAPTSYANGPSSPRRWQRSTRRSGRARRQSARS